MQLEGHRNHSKSGALARRPLVLGGNHLELDRFAQATQGQIEILLSDSPEVLSRVKKSRELVEQAVARNDAIYGVTTGFGGMANDVVPQEMADGLQRNLLNFLSTGVGAPIESRHVRGAMLMRANMLLKGRSGIRMELIERLVRFVQQDAIPVVCEHGSIGASGDLVPLAVIARAITGHQNSVPVLLKGQPTDSRTVLSELGYAPIDLKAKEGLALVNGTSFSTSIAASALLQSRRLFLLAVATQGIFLRSLLAHEEAFDDFVHQSKPHPGQVWVARTMLEYLSKGAETIDDRSHPVQDRYSIRCLPQYLGPIAESLYGICGMVETELNGVSDNPLVDLERGRLVQSGNFLGQSVAMGMDELRRLIALTAKHLDLQIALLVSPEFSGGLSASLRGNSNNPMNMGLKGLQIAGNSIVPMLLQQSAPLVEHFPTYAEQYNQNVNGLSWGASNLAWKSADLFGDYLAIAILFAIQSADMRCHQLFGSYDGRRLLGSALEPLYTQSLDAISVEPNSQKPLLFDDQDRCLEQDVASLSKAIKSDATFTEVVEPALQSFEESLGGI